MGFNFNVFCLVAGESTRTHFIGYPLFPIKLFSMITLGYTISDRWIYYEEDYDAGGEVISIGLLGRKIASGSIYGSFFDIPIPGLYSIYEFHVGIIGFTGVRLGVLGYYFYFGSALFTSVDYLF
jgi:hypothetical protein